MNIDNLLLITIMITAICIILVQITGEEKFLIPCFVLVIILVGIYLSISQSLNSELIIEEYLRNSYESNIKKDDISEILKYHDKDTKLIDIETYKIPNSKSLYVKLDIRKGKPIYRDLKYKYTIGINDNKVFIKKGD